MRSSFLFALALLLFFSTNSFSQALENTQEGEEKFRIHFAPLNLFDPATGVAQIGIQKSLNHRFAVSVDYGIKAPLIKAFGYKGFSERKDYNYSKTKAEVKLFLSPKGHGSLSRVFSYLAMEGMFFPQKYYKVNNWIHRGDISYMYTSSDIKRTVWVASLKFGKETRYRKVIIDKFIGIGIRHMTIKHQTTGEAEGDYYEPADLYFSSIDENEGTFLRPHISLGVKFGYSVWKNNY